MEEPVSHLQIIVAVVDTFFFILIPCTTFEYLLYEECLLARIEHLILRWQKAKAG
jgi:hypothetical protein